MRKRILGLLAACALGLMGCGAGAQIDDYATNEGYETDAGTASAKEEDSGVSTGNAGIAANEIKIGVLHLTDPAEGSGYTYTHDLGIQGMQKNLGLSDSQIVRKINVDDTDADATRTAIQECIDEGCNIIFTTSC